MNINTHNRKRIMKPASAQSSSRTQAANLLVEEYLKSLTPVELKAYHIAKSHLGTTFNIEKANAFLRWKTEREAQSSSPTCP